MYSEVSILTENLDRLLLCKDMVLVAIDGNCTAGKTTLAEALACQYDCNVFHMDDFFLRPEQRTAERLAEMGGNVDYERFYEEILLPLKQIKQRETFLYHPYDCRSQRFCRPVEVTRKALNIVEGTYSMHPSLAAAYDFSVFLQISPLLQRSRILQRDAALHQRFFTEWIPMEQRYFAGCHVAERCDLVWQEPAIL